MSDNNLDHYTTQSKYSDPDNQEHLLKNLPDSVEDLVDIVYGLVTQRDDVKKLYGIEVPKDRLNEPDTRYVSDILKRIIELDNSPLIKVREPDQRFFGSCRDFALLLCSFLRHQNIPARVRCGFGTYFRENWHSDHWVCEYWNKEEERWVLVDAELGHKEKEFYKINLSPRDLSRDEFLVSGRAWRLCREGKADLNTFGVKSIGVKGVWFIRGSLVRDLAALNKIELLPWDYTDYTDNPSVKSFDDIPTDELETLDSLAEVLSQPSTVQNDLAKFFEVEYLTIPNTITSYTISGPKKVELDL